MAAIYLRDVFAVEPFVGRLGVTTFSLATAIGRLGMATVVYCFESLLRSWHLYDGHVKVATAAHPLVALVGFGLTGIGCSSVYPLAISAETRRSDSRA